jgi:hypothetical protein
VQKLEKLPARPRKRNTSLFPAEKRNAQRINQWKAKRNEAVGDTKVNAQAQTENSNSQIGETTQTDQQHSHDQVLHKPSTITQRRERSTQTTTTITGKQLIPTKYLNTEESQKPWRKCTSVRSPYMRGKICYKAEFEDGSVSFSEAFDPDDPSLIDRHTEYNTDTHLGDRPPTPTQQREERCKLKASRKKSNMSIHGQLKDNLFLPLFNTNFISKSFGGPLHNSVARTRGKARDILIL